MRSTAPTGERSGAGSAAAAASAASSAATSPAGVSRSIRRAYSGSRSFHVVSSGAAMKIDEYAPDAMPTSSANAKSFSVAPPKMSSERTGSSVMNVVASERRMVSQSETLAIVANGARRISGMFSRIRSKMMIVS